MMQFFRSIAKPLILVTAIAFFIWLVVDLSGLSGGGGILTRTTVGKVNGTAVDLRAFQTSVQEATQERQSRTAGTLGLEEQAEIRDQVWEQAVQEIIFRAEYDRYGIRVSDLEVAEAIRGAPPQDFLTEPTFQTDGKFDLEKYHAWLSSSSGQAFIPVLEQRYREQILRMKLFQRVTADIAISDPTLWERYRDEHEQVKVGILAINPEAAIPDGEIRVEPQEIDRYYRDHKEEFRRNPEAFVSYIAVPRSPNASDTAAARERIMTLRAEIAGGTPFEEVARRESADTLSGRNGGDLGELQRSAVDSAFGAAAMSLPLNRLSEPVLSRFGFHLILVESRTGESFKARHLLVPIEVTGTHRDYLDQRADSLENLAAERLERSALDTAARALGLRIGRAGPLLQGVPVSTPVGGQTPDVSIWAFQAQPEEHSPVIEAEHAFMVFRLDSLHEGGVPPLSAIRAQVDGRVRLEKKLQAARTMATRLADQAGGSGSAAATPLWQLATQSGMAYRTEGPFARLSAPLRDPALVGAAFAAGPGGIAGPVAGSDMQVYLFQVLEKVPADSADFVKNLAAIRGQALQGARQSRWQAYALAVRSTARIVDYRAEVFRTNAQTAAAQPAAVP